MSEFVHITKITISSAEISSVNDREIYEYLEIVLGGDISYNNIRNANKFLRKKSSGISEMMYSLFLDKIDLAFMFYARTQDEENLSHEKTYLAKHSISGLYKIGKTKQKNVEHRLSQIDCGGGRIELIHVINKNIENTLHEKFKHKRLNGEWFKLSKKEVKSIREIK